MIQIKKISNSKILEINLPNDYINKELEISVKILDDSSNYTKNEMLEFFKEGPTISSAEISEINNVYSNLVKWNTTK